MFALLLPISLGLLFLIIHRVEPCWRRSLLQATIAWGVWLVILTETLNLFGKISFPWILAGWLCFTVGLGVVYVRYWALERSFHLKFKSLLPAGLTAFQWFCLGGMLAIALILAVVAIVAAPNTADSMIYHLARVANWIQNQNINPYPTRVVLQLDQPPWNSYTYLQIMVLSGGDFFVGLVQWSCLILNAMGVSLIAQFLGANLTGQLLASVFCMTIPMAILQGSTTQNDLIVSFWLVCFMVSTLDLAQNGVRRTHALELGASLGLALLTKGTAYIYAPPMILLALWSIVRQMRWQTGQMIALIGLMVVGLNVGHWWRNFVVFGSPLGVGGDVTRNHLLTTPALLSNIIRNLAMHWGTIIPGLNATINAFVLKLHEWIGISTDYSLTTWPGQNFDLPSYLFPVFLTENRSGNPVHLLLIILSIVLFLGRKRLWNWQMGSYLSVLTAGFLTFCLLLKWQIWGTRLQLPLFVLVAPFVSVVLVKTFSGKAFRYSLVSVLFLLTVPYLLLSRHRPLIVNSTTSQLFALSPQSILVTPREQMYFTQPATRAAVPEVAELLHQHNCQQIGLDTRVEYPFWVTLRHHQSSGEVPPLRFRSITNEIPKAETFEQPSRRFTPCAVIRLNPTNAEQLPFDNAEQYQLVFGKALNSNISTNLQLYLHRSQPH